MSSVRSGIPRTLPSGVIIGATDMREFPVATGVPAGLTFHGTPGTPQIINLAGEGNVFEEISTNSGSLEIEVRNILRRGICQSGGSLELNAIQSKCLP